MVLELSSALLDVSCEPAIFILDKKFKINFFSDVCLQAAAVGSANCVTWTRLVMNKTSFLIIFRVFQNNKMFLSVIQTNQATTTKTP